MVGVSSLNSSTGKADGEDNYLNAGSADSVLRPTYLSGGFNPTLYKNVLTESEKFHQVIAIQETVFINSMAGTSTPNLPPTGWSQGVSVRTFRTYSDPASISDLRGQWIKRGSGLQYVTILKFVSRPEQSSSDDSTIIGGSGFSKASYLPWVMNALRDVNPDAAERINELRQLEEGWDGYGAPPPTREATQVTASLLLAIHKLARGAWDDPFIAPLPDGGLELEWEFESGNEVMLIISSEGSKIKYLLDETTPSGEIIESEGLVPQDLSLSELIRRVV